MIKEEIIYITVAAIMIVIAIIIMSNSANDCKSKGGFLVRGIVGFDCIKGEKL